MVVLGTFFLTGVVSALVFASFVLARIWVGSAFRVADRVAPFGEARPSGFASARPGARLAVTLAGPLGVYVTAASLCVLALLLGASRGEGTTIVEVVPARPAAAAGLQQGDRIVSVDGTPVARSADMRPVLTARSEGPVDVVIERKGVEMRIAIVPDVDRKLGVQLGPNPNGVGVGRAISLGVAYPYEVLVDAVTALVRPVTVELVGPIGSTAVIARKPTFADRLLTIGVSQAFSVIWFLLAALVLWAPGIRQGENPGPGDPIRTSDDGVVVPRPGLRMWARLIDWTLIAVVAFAAPPPMAVLVWLIAFPIEALFLSRWGFTPGKWLLRIAVRDAHGRRPTFGGAFHRAGVVWVYGYGANTLFGLATGVFAYGSLKRAGTTYWDTLGSYVVHHRPVGAGRRAIAALVLAAATAASIALAFPEA